MKGGILTDIDERLGRLLRVIPRRFLRQIGKTVFPRCQAPQLPKGSQTIAIVLGGGQGNTREAKALHLYNDNKVAYIVVTGGFGCIGNSEGATEADRAREFLIKNKVPEDKIIVENKSTNTAENVRNSLDILAERHFLSAGTNLIVVTHAFHIQRSMLLLSNALIKKGHPNVAVSWLAVEDEKFGADTWYKHPAPRFWVTKEWLRLLLLRRKSTSPRA